MILVFSPCSLAENWTGSVSITKEVPDDSSVEAVKRTSLDELKVLAANQAGSYLVETETISGSQYTQELSLISSAFVKLENVEFNRVSEGGRLYINSSARATVSLDEIERRVGYIRDNRVLTSTVKALLEHQYEKLNMPDLDRLVSKLSEINGVEVLGHDLVGAAGGKTKTARFAGETLVPLLADSTHGVLVTGYHDEKGRIVSINYFVEPPIESIANGLERFFRVDFPQGESGSELVIRGARYLSREIVEDIPFDFLAENEVVFDVLVNGKVRLTKPVLVRGNDSRFNPCGPGMSKSNSHSLCIIGYGSRSVPVRADLKLVSYDKLVITSRLRLIDKSMTLQ